MKKSNILIAAFVVISAASAAKAENGMMGNLTETSGKISSIDMKKDFSKAQTVLDNFYTGDINKKETKTEPVVISPSVKAQDGGQTCPGCGSSGVAQYTDNKSAWEKIRLNRNGAVPELSPFDPTPSGNPKSSHNTAAGALALSGAALLLVGGKKIVQPARAGKLAEMTKETDIGAAVVAGAITGAVVGAAAGGVGAGPGAAAGAIIGGMGAAISNAVEAINAGIHGS